jgi:peptidyl-prolyl cis-trans isomerase A (cyclophilin A)
MTQIDGFHCMLMNRYGARRLCLLILFVFSALFAGSLQATNVIIKTSLGDVELELFDEAAPQTVANFLTYVESGAFTNSFIHRSVPGFIVQGGGFTFANGAQSSIPTNPPVINEPGISNTRGTIAMAKLGNDPNSATSQWFINLGDNSANLDAQNDGFTVFGQVIGDGMQVIDAIAALMRWDAGAPFSDIPLIDYSGSGTITEEHLVFADVEIAVDFLINAGLNDTWLNLGTGGQGFFITVFPDIGKVFLAWFTYDTERPDQSITAILGDAGHRWLTAFGSYVGNTATLDIEITSGGVFDSATPAPTQMADGTIMLEFIDCENGTVSFNIPSQNLQGVIPIVRIAADNVPRCVQMATQ